MNEEEVIEKLKEVLNTDPLLGTVDFQYSDVETVLNILEKKDINIIETKEANRQLSVELQKKDKQIEQYQNMLVTNDMLHVLECEKKDKIIDEIQKEVRDHIGFENRLKRDNREPDLFNQGRFYVANNINDILKGK